MSSHAQMQPEGRLLSDDGLAAPAPALPGVAWRIDDAPVPYEAAVAAMEAQVAAIRAGTAPELIALDTGSGCMISRWVPGSLLADTGADATTLAAYLRTLHHAIPPVDRAYDPLAQVRAHLECARSRRSEGLRFVLVTEAKHQEIW